MATKAVAGLGEAGKKAFDRLARLVRRKLSLDSRSSGTLHRAQTYPASGIHRRDLADELSRAMVDDPHFAEQLVNLWRYVRQPWAGVARVVGRPSVDLLGSPLWRRQPQVR